MKALIIFYVAFMLHQGGADMVWWFGFWGLIILGLAVDTFKSK